MPKSATLKPSQQERPPSPPTSPKKRAAEVLELLREQQGVAVWHQRYDPTTELVFTILSQHTSDVNSERAGHKLKATFSSWDAVADADPADVAEAVKSAGLSKQKVPRIQGTLKRVRELTGDYDLTFLKEMPLADAKAWLRALPGVGPKTTAIVLSFALGLPAMAVDVHVFRVTGRLGLIGPKVNVDKAHDVLEAMLPPDDIYGFHVALIAHGRQVCKALRPRCASCVLRDGCPGRRE
jgi:endonuclease-3